MMKEYRSNASSKALFVLGGILVFICTFIFMTNLMKTPVSRFAISHWLSVLC